MSAEKTRQFYYLASRSTASAERARKKEQLCKIYGHCPSKLKVGRSMICSVCNRRFSSV